MKNLTKRMLAFIIASIFIFIEMTVPVFAANDTKKDVTITYREIKVSVDGKELIFTNLEGEKLEPFIAFDTVYVPISAAARALGKNSDYNAKTNQININGTAQAIPVKKDKVEYSATKKTTLIYKNIKIFINGNETTLKDIGGNKQEPFIAFDTVYVPLTALARALGKTTSVSMGGTPANLKNLPINQSLKKGMTDEEFNKAYNIAYDIISNYAGLSKVKQIEAVFIELAYIRHTTNWEYSMAEKHYSDIYGFFVLNMTSCAGDVRAAAICLTILGIPYEHVNEDQYDHQWIRVELDGDYVVVDINAPYLGYENEPYKHPLIW